MSARGPRRVVQVVPYRESLAEGVGGFAEALGSVFTRAHGVEVVAVVGEDLGENVRRLRDALCAATGDDRPHTSVLLHYVGYAYSRNGVPDWLIDGIDAWRRARPGTRLVTFFHEVFASGPPWRRSFWSSPRQAALAARLARLSDARATTLHRYRQLLDDPAQGPETRVMPIASLVGEPQAVPLLAARPKRLAVLGGAGNRKKTYARHSELAAACSDLGIESIVDIGPPLSDAVTRSAPVPVERLGVLSADEVSAQLLAATAGALAYPPAFLAKSSVFAGYCAHGLVPVCLGSKRQSCHPLDATPWWPHSDPPQEVAGRAADWYRLHDLAKQAIHYLELLSPGPS